MKHTIKVAYVNQPKPGKTKGSVKTAEGRYYDVEPEMLPLFKAGDYEVEVQPREYNGKTYYAIKSIVGQNGSVASNGNGVPHDKDREQRIIRQHSQTAATAYFAITGTTPTPDQLRNMIDWYNVDAYRPRPLAKQAAPKPAPVPTPDPEPEPQDEGFDLDEAEA